MTDSTSPRQDDSGDMSVDDPASAAIAQYFVRVDQGGRVDREAFIAEHPDVADQIREFFEGANLVEQLAGPTFAEQTVRLSLADTARSQIIDETIPGLLPSQASTMAREPVVDAAIPQQLGRYRLERIIGRGAMGTVYLAHDEQLHRDVALKVPRFEVDGSRDELMQRFFREARSVALLRDAGICPVYDVDEIDGIHFITMAYIDGQPLSYLLRDGQHFEPRESAVLVLKVARALSKAHEHGIVHRDVKPGNVMIDRDNEPVIMDFGLAARLDMEDVRVTQHGTLLGTPAYMSPEQVAGDPEAISASSDIFSLGVILYELLAGRLPFEGTILSIAHQIANDDPPPITATNPNIDQALAGICFRMLARNPAHRFASMEDVAAALREYLIRGDSAEELPAGGTTGSTGRSARRPDLRAALRLLVLAVVGAIIVIGVDFARGPGNPVSDHAVPTGPTQPESTGTSADTAQPGSTGSTTTDSGPPVPPVGSVTVFDPDHWPIRDVAASADGRFLATANSWSQVKLWESASGRPVERRDECVDPECEPFLHTVKVDISQDGRLLAGAGGTSLAVWSTETGELVFRHQPGGTVLDVAFSPDGAFVLTSTDQGEMQLWQSDSGELERRFQLVPYEIRAVSFSPDGRYIFSGESRPQPDTDERRAVRGRRLLKQWNVETGELLRIFHGETGGVSAIDISPDATSLLTGGKDGIVRRWDLDNGQVVQTFRADAPITDLQHAPDGRYFAACVAGRPQTQFWQFSPVRELPAPVVAEHHEFSWELTCLDFAPDGRQLIVGGIQPDGVASRGLVRTHELTGELSAQPSAVALPAAEVPRIETVVAQPLQRFRGHTDEVFDIEFLSGSDQAFSAGGDGMVRHWSVSAGRSLNAYALADGFVRDLAISPGDRLLATGHQNGAVNLYAAATGQRVLKLDGHRDPVDSVHFSDDGSRLASAGRDGFVRVWNVDDGSQLHELRADPVANWTVRFLAGNRLFAAGERHSRLWDLSSERVLKTFGTGNRLYFGAEPAPDGQRVVFGNYDGQIGVWNFDGDASGVLIGQHSRFVSRSKVLAGDGRFAVTGGAEAVLVTDLKEGNTVYRLNLGSAGAGVLALSPDARFLLVTARDPYLENGPGFALQLFELPLFVRRSASE